MRCFSRSLSLYKIYYASLCIHLHDVHFHQHRQATKLAAVKRMYYDRQQAFLNAYFRWRMMTKYGTVISAYNDAFCKAIYYNEVLLYNNTRFLLVIPRELRLVFTLSLEYYSENDCRVSFGHCVLYSALGHESRWLWPPTLPLQLTSAMNAKTKKFTSYGLSYLCATVYLISWILFFQLFKPRGDTCFHTRVLNRLRDSLYYRKRS